MSFDFYDHQITQVLSAEVLASHYDHRLRCCECQTSDFPLDSPKDSSDLFCPQCLEDVEAELALEASNDGLFLSPQTVGFRLPESAND